MRNIMAERIVIWSCIAVFIIAIIMLAIKLIAAVLSLSLSQTAGYYNESGIVIIPALIVIIFLVFFIIWGIVSLNSQKRKTRIISAVFISCLGLPIAAITIVLCGVSFFR
jgi:hypothetical protein